MRVTPPPLPQRPFANLPPAASSNSALKVVIWVVWLGVCLAADFLAFLMFAFADSPGSARTAQAMIAPAFAWFGFTLLAGVILLIRQRLWRIVLAFALAASPPFVIFAGYNLLDGSSASRSSTSNPATGPPATAPFIRTPQGGFAPKFTTPEQPDFRKTFPGTATTRPAATSKP